MLDGYLRALGSWLPKAQRADIVAEITEDLRSEVEEKERALGRSLVEAELGALLERRGHPMWVAEAYLPQRHLIGPAVLPLYWRALLIAIPCILAVFVVLGVVFTRIVTNPPQALGHVGFWIWQFGLWSFAYVGLFTVIFALVDRSQARARAAGRWDPRDPSALPAAPADPEAKARRSLRVHATADIVGDILVLSWLLGVQPAAMPTLGIVLTPVWHALHWPIAVLLASSIAVALADAIRPSWTRPRLIARLAVDVPTLAFAAILLAAGPWVQVTSTSLLAAHAATIEMVMNQIWLSVLLVIAVIYAVRVILQLRRLAAASSAAPSSVVTP